jgi:hypothetical protein
MLLSLSGEIHMIQYRPHHFLCTLGFQGKGYSPQFIDNFQQISDILNSREGDGIPIQVVQQTDSICGPCPHKRGALCKDQEKIAVLDVRHQEVLSLHTGQVLTWGEAKEKIKTSISYDKFQEICEGCSWRDLGYCAQALKELQSENVDLLP